MQSAKLRGTRQTTARRANLVCFWGYTACWHVKSLCSSNKRQKCLALMGAIMKGHTQVATLGSLSSSSPLQVGAMCHLTVLAAESLPVQGAISRKLNENRSSEMSEMARSTKHLAHRQEDLSLICRTIKNTRQGDVLGRQRDTAARLPASQPNPSHLLQAPISKPQGL